MRLIKYFVLWIFISCQFKAYAQSFTFVNYSKSHHLGSQLVDITQDNNGNLWMVGLLGQFFFHDGSETKAYSFPEHLFTSNIFRIAADANNTIWLLTDRGLISFNGETFEKLSLPPELKPGYKSQLLVDSNNRVWIMDENRTIGYTGAQGIRLFTMADIPGDSIQAVTRDSEKNIWLATHHGLLIKINENVNAKKIQLKELLNKDIEAVDFLTNQLTVVAEDSIYTFINFKLTQKEFIPGVEKSVLSVISDANANVWIFEREKLWRIKDGTKLLINESFGLTDNKIVKIFKDNKNFLWVLTDAKGTFRYSNQPFDQTIIDEESIVSAIFPLRNQRGVLFGTYGKGLFLKKSPTELTKVITKSKLDQSIIISIHEEIPDSYLIATHGEGLFRLLPNDGLFDKVFIQKPDQPDRAKLIRCMVVSGDTVLIGTANGLFARVGSHWKLLTGETKIIVNCFLPITPKQILIGSTKGLYLLENSRIVKIDSANYQSTGINTIKKDAKGNFWIGSNRKEVAVYNTNLIRISEFELPLPYSGIFVIEFIDSQTALIGIGGELATALLIKFTHDYKIASNTIYGPSHGWPDPDFVLGAFTSLKNGSLWIGTSSGAFEYKPAVLNPTETPPGSYIKKVKLLNSSDDINRYASRKRGFFRLPDSLMLPHYLNSLIIGFKGNDLSGPRSIQYRFRLKGLNFNWSEWASQDEVIYTNLKPGLYEFEAQAMNDQGVTGAPVVYSFTILPAFWQTWWFYLLVVLLLTILFIVFNRLHYRIKIRDYQKQESIKKDEATRIKQQMSMDFHDELGNKLAGVISYASALKHSSKNREFDAALDYIGDNAQEIYHRTKDFIWAIDVESNNLLQVLIYLRDFGVNFFERNNISFEVKSTFDPEIFNRALPEGYNRQIILIFKEAMTNILKHANCKHVDFSASTLPNGVVKITIEDDGKGISSPMGSGSGLRNMKKRAGGINGAFEIIKSDLGGLKITLEFRI